LERQLGEKDASRENQLRLSFVESKSPPQHLRPSRSRCRLRRRGRGR
jgi:hypothetical protein